jgi:hypothetical protein
MTTITQQDLWQQVFKIPEGQHRKLTLGVLNLIVSHLENEWQLRYHYSSDDESGQEKKLAFSELKKLPTDNSQLIRIMRSQKSEEGANLSEISFQPCLADRSIVAKPQLPIYLPAKDSTTIYVSTPIWLGIKIADKDQQLLQIPSFKLADTWFGPRPHVGEMCYASRFSGRTNLQLLPKRISRIITPVKVVNNANDNLKLEKIAIPTAYLSIYLTASQELWTPELKICREIDQKNTRASIEKGLPDYVSDASLICEAREKDASGLLGKTLDRLFS